MIVFTIGQTELGSHLARIDASDSRALLISSSQLMSRGVAAARLRGIQRLGVLPLLLVELRDVGDLGIWRWCHSISLEMRAKTERAVGGWRRQVEG